MTSSKLNHFLKAPPPNISTLGDKVSTSEFGGHKYSVHNTRVCYSPAQIPPAASKKPTFLTSATRSYTCGLHGEGSTGSAQEIYEGISWWSQELGGDVGTKCSRPGMLGRLKITHICRPLWHPARHSHGPKTFNNYLSLQPELLYIKVQKHSLHNFTQWIFSNRDYCVNQVRMYFSYLKCYKNCSPSWKSTHHPVCTSVSLH